jgi:hypothetical protein
MEWKVEDLLNDGAGVLETADPRMGYYPSGGLGGKTAVQELQD